MPAPAFASAREWLDPRVALVLASAVVFVAPARAGLLDDVGGFFGEKAAMIETALTKGRTDLYLTGYAWHVPWAYDAATRGRLNEKTWGGGFGRSARDDDGDRHSVFFLAFADSHRTTQFIASYGWQRYQRLDPNWSLGWGYLAFLFSRADVKHYLPLPAALPCASVRYRQWEVTGLFVPKVSKDIKGDVFFVFLRVAL